MPAFGSRPQAIATPSVIVAWTSWARATGSHARAIRMASRASRCASEKMPSTMCSWARVATTVARSGDGSRGTSSTARRRRRPGAGLVAGGAPDVGHALEQQTHAHPIATGVETRDGRFQVGGGTVRAPDMERGLRGAVEQGRAVREPRRGGLVRAPAGAGRWRVAILDGQGQFEVAQLVGIGGPRAGQGGRGDGGDPSGARVVRLEPVPRGSGRLVGHRGRQRRVVTATGHRQQVALHGRADRDRGGNRRPHRARRGTRAPAPRPGPPAGRRRGRPSRVAGCSPNAARVGPSRSRTRPPPRPGGPA